MRLSCLDATLYQSGVVDMFSVPINKGEVNHYTMQILKEDGDRYLQTNSDRYLQISGRFACGDNTYQLDMLFALEELYHSRNTQISNYHWIYIAVLSIGALVSWLVIHCLTNPLRELSLTVQRITTGDLSCRAKIQTDDEIGSLAIDFNQMTNRLEKNIKDLKSAMERQEEFMGSFAHEMKTPMTAIIGYADLMRTSKLDESEMQESASFIFHEGKRLESLSQKMLDLLVAERKELSFFLCRPADVIKNVARIVEPVLQERDITFRYDLCEGTCMMDSDLVHSLLINLIDNARKATESGGEISLKAEMIEDGCIFEVKDTGCGMASVELDKITDAFYRVDKSRSRAQGGAGLGLAICKKIAQIHGGSITFTSAINKGTTVRVTIRGGRYDQI